MARIARVVLPGHPHHITQRGSRRQRTFFCEADYKTYIRLMAQWTRHHGVEVWAYCLMPNHVHLIATPGSVDALRQAIGEAHRRYTCMINCRQKWTGYLWQGRFHSFAMDESHLLAAARYIELNPVKAGLCAHPQEYAWSSARAHLAGCDDGLVAVSPLLRRVSDWTAFLSDPLDAEQGDLLESHERTGRPLGNPDFLMAAEKTIGRTLTKARPGPKPRHSAIN